MLTLDLWFFAIAGPAVLFAGISKGGFGSGAAFAASSVLAIVVDPGFALGVMLPMLMLIDAVSLKSYWGRWHTREALLVIAGALPGIALGAALYRIASPDLLRLLIGTVSVGFVGWQISAKRGWLRFGARHMSDGAGVVAGLAVGFTSFVSHAGGPPAAVFLLSRNLGKTGYQATSVLIFWAVNLTKFIPYAFLGMFTLETAKANLVLAPFAIFGAWLGVRAHRIVPERLFFALTYVFLTLTGLKLIWDGLT
mgnify:CR=1 FL=1